MPTAEPVRRPSLPARLTLLGLTVVIAAAGALLLEVALSRHPDRPFGHTVSGYAAGWVALALVALVFVYSVRKRYGRKPGWPRGAFQLHMVAGALVPLVALLHAGFHVHAFVPLLTLVTLAVVVLSGLFGQLVHYLALQRLHAHRQTLLDRGLTDEAVEEVLHGEAAREELFRLWQYVHAPLTVTFLFLLLWHIAGALYFGGL